LNKLLLFDVNVLKLFGHCGVSARFARDRATRPMSKSMRKLVLLDKSMPVILVTIEMSKMRIIIWDKVKKSTS